MAVAFVKALQSAAGTSTTASTTVAVTTNGAVAAGNFIVGLATSRLTNPVTLSSVSGGSLTWAVDATTGGVTGTSEGMGLFSAQCPAGLASGTTITATFSASSSRKTLMVFEFSGIATSAAASSPVTNNANPGTFPVTIGTVTCNSGDLVVGGLQANTSNASLICSAGTGFTVPSTGDANVGTTSQSEGMFEYQVASTTSLAVTAACSSNVAYSGGGIVYAQAATAIVAPPRPRIVIARPVPVMTQPMVGWR